MGNEKVFIKDEVGFRRALDLEENNRGFSCSLIDSYNYGIGQNKDNGDMCGLDIPYPHPHPLKEESNDMPDPLLDDRCLELFLSEIESTHNMVHVN